ncbi:cutinase family protein [Mycobacterium lacus]|uniref:Cutinase n=1 Tax=Mycobacterium lacus TaxID=169765 RepID=A0A1X1Y6Q2_9MYCO|nr:cutinase family protein [Mycobacterium lacus]MCV7125062.1 cutinase family protein [Mycobacterium lacus]ORW06681.1 cutinase [Mycobacterium lacus]BBX96409.1 cutinase [Mycobacterium lacus]
MNVSATGRFVGAAVVTACAPLIAPVPSASAVPLTSNPSCPDVEVVFARGTGEPPGVGEIGQAFVDSLRPKISPKSMTVYPVNYPATMDFPTAMSGINDAGSHVEQTVANCPDTKMVLGGFSQGAAIIGFVTSAAVPDGAPSDAPKPLPPDVADHIAAVTLFGTPSSQFMNSIGAPPIVIGPLYAAKTSQLCTAGDPVCSAGGDWAAHNAYAGDGMVDQAATFAAGHLSQTGRGH